MSSNSEPVPATVPPPEPATLPSPPPEPATLPSPPPEPAGRHARMSYRLLTVAVGTSALVWDRLLPSRQRPLWADAAVGVLFEAEAAIASLPARPPAMAAKAGRHLAALAGRGQVERDRARKRVTDLADAVIDAIATSPVVDRVVDVQLDRVVRPMVAVVLDDVFASLEANPARVQGLVRGQSTSMVGELVGRIRGGAFAGDAAVDRVTARLLGRTADPTPAPVGEPPP